MVPIFHLILVGIPVFYPSWYCLLRTGVGWQGGRGGVLNGQNPLSMMKVISWQSLNYCSLIKKEVESSGVIKKFNAESSRATLVFVFGFWPCEISHKGCNTILQNFQRRWNFVYNAKTKKILIITWLGTYTHS